MTRREFLRAGNLGVRAMATIHGNSAESALVRLADLAIREGVPLRSVREQAADAVDLVVHMARQGGRRYVAEVAWVRGVDDAGHFSWTRSIALVVRAPKRWPPISRRCGCADTAAQGGAACLPG